MKVYKFIHSSNKEMSNTLEGKLCTIKKKEGDKAEISVLNGDDVITTSSVVKIDKNGDTVSLKTNNSVYVFEYFDIYKLLKMNA